MFVDRSTVDRMFGGAVERERLELARAVLMMAEASQEPRPGTALHCPHSLMTYIFIALIIAELLCLQLYTTRHDSTFLLSRGPST